METSYGPVPIWGRIEPDDRPLLFVIRGVMPERDHLLKLAEWERQASVALVHLPGMHTPFFGSNDLKLFGAAFDEVVERLNRPTVVLGVSMGGISALAMNCSLIRKRVLVDTPLTTDRLWPLAYSVNDPRAAQWMADVIGPDYSAVAGPCVLLKGADPLMPKREVSRMPSLVSDDDVETYLAAGADLIVVPDAGHNIPRDGTAVLQKVVRDSLLMTAGDNP